MRGKGELQRGAIPPDPVAQRSKFCNDPALDGISKEFRRREMVIAGEIRLAIALCKEL